MANQEHLDVLLQGVAAWNFWRETHEDVVPNLQEADLSGLNLTGANLSRADLTKANLTGATLAGADLSRADLSQTQCSEADFAGATLIRADFTNAQCNGATFEEAKLTDATLIGTDLQGANLSGSQLDEAKLLQADLEDATLTDATLSRAVLIEADLTRADLSGAVLDEANLREAILNKANLANANLHDTILDEKTRFRGVRGVIVGVNGFWDKETDTTALLAQTPDPHSMLGQNPEAVVESLKRARRLHYYSFGLGGLAIVLSLLGLRRVSLNKLLELDLQNAGSSLGLPIEELAFMALLFSAGLLTLVKFFMADALDGARYLQDRASAMMAGNFPWVLSRYAGTQPDKKILSLLARVVLAFHPVAYVFLPYTPTAIGWHHYIVGAWVLGFSIWIFILSQQFQRPILFDRRTEQERQSEVERVADVFDAHMKGLARKLQELIDLLKK